MTSLRTIKTKIINIKKIKKITTAMHNIAVSKVYKSQQQMKASCLYTEKICRIINGISYNLNKVIHNPYIDGQLSDTKKVGYIVVTTDHGLCGALNLNIFKIILENAKILKKDGIDIDWCFFGKKAENFIKSLPLKVVAHTSSIGEKPGMSKVIGNIKVMLDLYQKQKLNKLFIAYNMFINSLTFKPVIIQLLPFPKTKNNTNFVDYIYEPSLKMLLDNLITRYIEIQTYQAVLNNIACEQTARMIAMQNATDSSQEMIESLQLFYNKTRQSAITKEISEIVSGINPI